MDTSANADVNTESRDDGSKKRTGSKAELAGCSAAKKPNNKSYRHLFTFGQDKNSPSSTHYRRPSNRFSLFGTGKAVFPGPGPQFMRAEEEDETTNNVYDNDGERSREAERAKPDEVEGSTTVEAQEKYENIPAVIQVDDDKVQQHVGRNHDARPGELERIATMFVREKPIEELEEEWSAPGGIRDQMRHEFKVRRQKASLTHSSAPARLR